MSECDYDHIYNDLIQPYHLVLKINNNSIYLGNQSTAGGMPDSWNYTNKDYKEIKERLLDLNIKSIICCADNVEKYPNDFKYLQIPMNNNKSFSIKESVEKAYNFILENIENGSIFIHCNAGVTRSASTVIYFLMKYNCWSFEKSHEYLINIRSCIDVELFREQLLNL